MTVLSATARRFIALAVEKLDDIDRASVWSEWDQLSSDIIPSQVAQIALFALSNLALHLESGLQNQPSKDAAQIENDLGYIAALEADLAESLMVFTPA